MNKPNTILNRFDCLRSDVKHESWEQLVEDFKDRCVTTQISMRLTSVLSIAPYLQYANFHLKISFRIQSKHRWTKWSRFHVQTQHYFESFRLFTIWCEQRVVGGVKRSLRYNKNINKWDASSYQNKRYYPSYHTSHANFFIKIYKVLKVPRSADPRINKIFYKEE